jgi:uncharacterized protein (TIGR02569 family)
MAGLTDPPPESVLAAYGVDARHLRSLPGGQGSAWQAGPLVLKPLDISIEQLAWQERLAGDIDSDGFRLAAPVRARNGKLQVAGWSAWQWLEGEHLPHRWADICAVGDRLHRATACIAEPAWHRRRTDVFARADRAAWTDTALAQFRSVPLVAELAGQLRPVHGRRQLIHGDLTGNVLFHPTLPPAVIDLSPYWRPTSFATAIVVVDALFWEGADEAVLAILADQLDAPQYLLRAAIFRIVMDKLCNPRRRTPPPWWPTVVSATAELCRLAVEGSLRR